MAITFNSCAHCNDCDDLVAEIDRRMNSNETSGDRGLQTRINDQIHGCQTPQDTINPHPACANHGMVGTWNGHNEAISAKWRNLQRGLEDFDNNDCGDKTSDPRTGRLPSPIMPRVSPSLRGAPPIMNRPVIIPRRGSGGGGGWQFQLFQILPVL